MSFIYNLADTWNASGTTFAGILLNVTNGAGANPVAAAASQVVNLQLNGVQTLGVRMQHLALGTDATPFLNLFDIWNTSANVTGIKYNVTNTASGASSLLLDLQVGTVSQAKVDSSGILTANNVNSLGSVKIPSGGTYQCNNGSNFILSGPGSALLQLGNYDAATATAQTLQVQNVAAGNTNNAGANWTINGSLSNGSGASGDIIFQTGGKGIASGSQNVLITALTIKGGTTNNTNVGFPSVVIGNAALATTATDGFLYITTGAGAPTGVPTSFTGRIPMYYDTTNNFLYFNNGGWKKSTVYA